MPPEAQFKITISLPCTLLSLESWNAMCTCTDCRVPALVEKQCAVRVLRYGIPQEFLPAKNDIKIPNQQTSHLHKVLPSSLTTCNYLSIPRRIFEIQSFWSLCATPSIMLMNCYVLGHHVPNYLLKFQNDGLFL
jgi:hypothetical protein